MKIKPALSEEPLKGINLVHDQVLGRARKVFGPAYEDPAVQVFVASRADHYVSELSQLLAMSARSSKVRRRQVYHLLASFDARFCALILASKQAAPISLEEACNLAAGLNPRADCGEPVSFYETKKANGGYRPIWNFGLKRRALQRLVCDILQVLWGPSSFDFARRGYGRDAAMNVLVSETEKEGGPRWYLTADINNCFGSFDQEKLLKLIPLPENVIRNCILVPQETIIHKAKQHTHTSEIAVLQGLPQGSLASFYIASKLLEPTLSQLQGKVVLSYADDIAVGTKTQKEAEANELLLGDLLADHPAGPLFMKSSVAHLGQPIDYLGYRLHRRWLQYGGGIRLTPSQKGFHRFEERLADKLRQTPLGKLDEIAERYMVDWARSNHLWDRSEAGDTLLYVTMAKVLSGIRWERMLKIGSNSH